MRRSGANPGQVRRWSPAGPLGSEGGAAGPVEGILFPVDSGGSELPHLTDSPSLAAPGAPDPADGPWASLMARVADRPKFSPLFFLWDNQCPKRSRMMAA